ncbi:MAG: MMPL family transporter [Alphaproteobacteria bacterium]|nr:MMPL family transporter [Alphaproteobacteria bacterium]
MSHPITSLYRIFVVAWVDSCRRSAPIVVVAALIIAAMASLYVVRTVAINSNTNDMLSPNLPFRALARELDRAFPQSTDEMVIVIDSANPDLVDDAAPRLVARLREQPALFGDVFYPEGEPFFRRNGLLYLDPPELDALSDRLAQAQPFLGALWQDPSLHGLFNMLTLALKEGPASGQSLDLDPVLSAIADVAEAQAAKHFGQLSWQELMGSGGDKRRFIVVHPALDYATLHPAKAAMRRVRALAAELSLDASHGLRVRITGEAALDHEELESVEKSVGFANVLALAVACLLLIAGLRSWRLVVPVLITLLVGLICSAALALLMVGEFNLLSVAFAVLFIGIGVDFGIHFAMRYREGVTVVGETAASLRWAAHGVGWPLFLCALAAAIGFFSFLPTDYRGLAELGLIAGVSMFVALITNLTLLPALLALMPLSLEAGTREAMERPLPRWLDLSRNSRTIVAGSLVLAAAAAVMATHTRFDFDPLHLKDIRSESVSTLYELMDDPRTSPYSISILAHDMNDARRIADRLAKLGPVSKTATIADYVPDGQDEKLSTIRNIAMFLSPMFLSMPQPPPSAAATKVAWTGVVGALAANTSAPA